MFFKELERDVFGFWKTWDDSMSNFPGVGNIIFLQDDFIEKYGKIGNLTDESIKKVISDKNRLIQDDELVKLLWHSVAFFYHADNKEARRKGIPNIEDSLPDLYGNFYIILILAGFPGTFELYRQKGWPEEVAKETLKDLNVWVVHFQNEIGITGLTHKILSWMTSPISGGLFKLGRLQFQNFIFNQGISVYKNQITEEIQVLCDNGIRYNRIGLIDGIGQKWDEENHWISFFQKTDDSVEGNPISTAGFAENRIVKLKLNEWKSVLRDGDDTVNIHIPAGEPLTPESCCDSFEKAKHFFAKYFPEKKVGVFVCFSWLLDNQFEDILKKESNILKFQHLGRIFPIAGESEATSRIFGSKAEKEGINTVSHNSSMQRAVADFINGGGILRNGGFFRLFE